jgi:hypothetical protein
VWLVIGLLALRTALGHGARTDRQGALRALADEPFGEVLLVVLVIGFAGYAAWRALAAAVGHRDEQDQRKRAGKRVASGARALLYASFAVSTASFLLHGQQAKGDKTAPLTARVMQHTGGRTLVLLVGVAVVVTGLAMAVRAVKGKHDDQLDTGRMPHRLRDAASTVGAVGVGGRGLVVVLIGAFLVKAAVQFRPKEAKGLDASLQSLSQQPFGKVLLLLVVLALLAYAVWSFVEAAYRRL